MNTDKIVSFDDEPLILVDANDNVTGHASKAVCHDGDGLLHRAFSVFLFDSAGRVLLQQRSAQKRLWPMTWANSCCSHPRRGESVDAAAHRRTQEELSVVCALRYAYTFIYHAQHLPQGSEHELCSVYVGAVHTPVHVNANEVHATQFMAPEDLDRALQASPTQYTPWLHLEWPRLRRDFWSLVASLRAA